MKDLLTRHKFAVSAALTMAILMGLLAADADAYHSSRQSGKGWLRNLVAMSRGRDVPWTDGFWAQNCDYYEQLLRGEHVVKTQQSLLAHWQQGPQPEYVWAFQSSDYLVFELRSNLHAAVSQDGPIATNSEGLVDREHTLAKASGVRRVALFGDSITRGFGTAVEDRYSVALEWELNARSAGSHREPIEMINFGVTSYVPTQMYYLATERAPAYHPDVYVMALTPLSFGPTWSDHLIRLIQGHGDLRYDFLRKAVEDAGVQASDSQGVARWKLAPYRLPILFEILARVKAQAEREHAQFMILLLPAVEAPAMSRTRFQGMRELIESKGIPVADVVDTFDRVDNIESVRVNWWDVHPNAAGHKLLADNLYRQCIGQPRLWSTLTGVATAP